MAVVVCCQLANISTLTGEMQLFAVGRAPLSVDNIDGSAAVDEANEKHHEKRASKNFKEKSGHRSISIDKTASIEPPAASLSEVDRLIRPIPLLPGEFSQKMSNKGPPIQRICDQIHWKLMAARDMST